MAGNLDDRQSFQLHPEKLSLVLVERFQQPREEFLVFPVLDPMLDETVFRAAKALLGEAKNGLLLLPSPVEGDFSTNDCGSQGHQLVGRIQFIQSCPQPWDEHPFHRLNEVQCIELGTKQWPQRDPRDDAKLRLAIFQEPGQGLFITLSGAGDQVREGYLVSGDSTITGMIDHSRTFSIA